MCAASTAESPATIDPAAQAPATLVIGLGNPLLGDDGVGWRVVGAVEAVSDRPDLAFDYLSVGGLSLMERLVGASRVILVDAVVSGRDPAGTVTVSGLPEFASRAPGHLDNAHDVSLAAALDVGRSMGAVLPDEVSVVTVEASRVHEFGAPMTPEVAAAVRVAADRVLALLETA